MLDETKKRKQVQTIGKNFLKDNKIGQKDIEEIRKLIYQSKIFQNLRTLYLNYYT